MGQTQSNSQNPEIQQAPKRSDCPVPLKSIFLLIASGDVEDVRYYFGLSHAALFYVHDNRNILRYLIEVASSQLTAEVALKMLDVIIEEIDKNSLSLGFFLLPKRRVAASSLEIQDKLLEQWNRFVATKDQKSLEPYYDFIKGTFSDIENSIEILRSYGEYIIDLKGEHDVLFYGRLARAIDCIPSNLYFLAGLFYLMGCKKLALAKIKVTYLEYEKVPLLGYLLLSGYMEATALLLHYEPELIRTLLDSDDYNAILFKLSKERLRFLCVCIFLEGKSAYDYFCRRIIDISKNISPEDYSNDTLLTLLLFNFSVTANLNLTNLCFSALQVMAQVGFIMVLLTDDISVSPGLILFLINGSRETVVLELIMASVQSSMKDVIFDRLLGLLFKSCQLESIRVNKARLLLKSSRALEACPDTEVKVSKLRLFLAEISPTSSRPGSSLWSKFSDNLGDKDLSEESETPCTFRF